MGSGAGDRGYGRVEPKTLPSGRHRGGRELTVAGRHRDPGQWHLIGDIHRVQRHDGEALRLAQRAQVNPCRGGVTFPQGNQSQEPRAGALSRPRARLKQRPGDGSAFADLRLVPGVHRHAPGRHGSLDVEAAGWRRLLHGGDDPVQRRGCLAKPADLQESAAAPALPFPHGPSLVVSLADDKAVSRQPECLVIAVESGEQLRPQPGCQQLADRLVQLGPSPIDRLDPLQRGTEAAACVFQLAPRRRRG